MIGIRIGKDYFLIPRIEARQMRDPFDALPHLARSSHHSSGEFPPAGGAGYLLGNGDAGFWNPSSDSLIR